jgi:hypothetical protein
MVDRLTFPRWLAAVVLALTLAAPAVAAEQKVQITDLIRETQQQSKNTERLTLVWWMPLEFWQASLAVSGMQMSPEKTEEFLAIVRPYLIVAVADGKMSPLGSATFVSEEVLRSGIKVVDSVGRSYLPIPDDKISADMKQLTHAMRPIFANLIGAMGENIRFFMFSSRDADGKEIASATSTRSFDIQLGERRFHWRLPLGSVLPLKVCPEDGEAMNGAWSFCPWHGAKLKAQEAPAAPAPPAATPPKPGSSQP